VVDAFQRIGLNHELRVLPCGHYTTGETPYQYIDGWYMGSFTYRAFKALREEKANSGKKGCCGACKGNCHSDKPAVTEEQDAELTTRS